jgi:opine dehydrogenase
MWRRDAAAFAPVLAAQRITLQDFQGTREVPLALASADIGEVVRGAELLLAPMPAFTQADLGRAIAPHVSSGQVVFMPPGTFGSYVMAKALRDAGSKASVVFAETGTLPYLTRKHGPAEVAITIRAKRLPTGAFPARESAHAMDVVRRAYPAIEPIEDALSGALMNAGPIIHPPLILMNAGPLDLFAYPENGGFTKRVPANVLALGKWNIHNEGTQASIRRVTDALDDERIAVREALGYRPYHFPLRDHYTTSQWMYGAAHDRLVDSGDWRENIDFSTHRYMREDVELGLAFLVSVARWAKVPCPIAQGLLSLGGTILGRDFLTRSPRTLTALGLASLDRDGMRRLLQDGL